MSLVIIAYCLLLRALDALHHEKAVAAFSPHAAAAFLGIVVAVAEEIVIAGIEEFRVLAHESAQAGVIRAGAVFVEAER